jgi:hypothetical protein
VSRQGPHSPGVLANERLTAAAGAVLLVLFAAEVPTVPTLRTLLSVHFFVRVLLARPLAVKMGSTGWRFLRYYTGAPPTVAGAHPLRRSGTWPRSWLPRRSC